MAINSLFLNNTAPWFAAGFLILAVGGGTYLAPTGPVHDPDLVRVGWWNIRDFGPSRDDHDIAQIAQCLDNIDVMAIGELNDPDALRRLTEELGPSWEWSATTQKVGRSPSSREHYGFIWNSDVVQMVGDVHVDPDPGDKIDREPAFATFATTDGHLDFTLMGVHITWGNLVGNRKAEIRMLDDVWNRTLNAMSGDNDLILMGDFNRNINDDSFNELDAITGVMRCNENIGPTVIKGTSTYDQIWLDSDDTTEWTGEYDCLPFDQLFFNDVDADASLIVSDHRPVWIVLAVPEHDDD